MIHFEIKIIITVMNSKMCSEKNRISRMNLVKIKSAFSKIASNAPIEKRRKFPARYCGLPNLIILVFVSVL